MKGLRIVTLTVLVGAVVGSAHGCGPPVVLDVAASGLEIQPAVLDLEATPSDGKVPVIVQFFQSGTFVQLATTNSVACNGVVLTWNGLGYAERVPIVAPGGSFAIVHSRGGVNTQVTMTVPARPVVTSPASGASIPRTGGLAIHYIAGMSEGVRPGAGDGTTGLSGAEQPDNGTAMLDVSSLHAGPGTIDISRRIVTSPSGIGFASVVATYTISSADTHITWQ